MRQTSNIALIFLLAFGMRLAALASFASEKSLYYVSDSYTYLQVAQNILTHGTYSMEMSLTPHPDNYRTPLYPLFLLPFVWLKASPYIPVILQSLIMSLGAVAVFLLGRELFGQRVAFVAAFLAALEPFSALISAQLLTEAIFTPLFICAFLLLALYIKTKNPKELFIGSLLLSLAALARPVAFYLFPAIPLAVVLANIRAIDWKRMAAGLGLFFLVVSPWLLFIVFKLHTLHFGAVSSFDLYAYHGKYFDAWRAERNPEITDRLTEIDLSPINDTLDARMIPTIEAVGKAYIFAHPFEYAAYHILRLPALHSDSGYAMILGGLRFVHLDFDPVKGGVLDLLLRSGPSAFLQAVATQPLLLILLAGDLFFILMAVLAFSNPLWYKNARRDRLMVSIFLVSILAIYTFLASPIGGARFRIPVNPLLFLLGIDALACLGAAFGERSKKHVVSSMGMDRDF